MTVPGIATDPRPLHRSTAPGTEPKHERRLEATLKKEDGKSPVVVMPKQEAKVERVE